MLFRQRPSLCMFGLLLFMFVCLFGEWDTKKKVWWWCVKQAFQWFDHLCNESKKMNESNRFMMRNFEWWLLSSVSCAFIISSDAVGGRASAHFPSAMNFSQPTHFIRFPPYEGNSPKRSTMQCREMQIHDEKCFSDESCDAQHGHKERWDFSPISGRKRSAISECAFNMSFAIGRLSEKRANKLLKKKRKVKRMFMICCCVT